MLVERITGRRIDPVTGNIYHKIFNPPPTDIAERCIQRDDDSREKAVERLRLYNESVKAITQFYKDCLVMLDGTGSKDAIADAIEQHLRRVAEAK